MTRKKDNLTFRTTIRLEERLGKIIQERAERDDRTLSAVVKRFIEFALTHEKQQQTEKNNENI